MSGRGRDLIAHVGRELGRALRSARSALGLRAAVWAVLLVAAAFVPPAITSSDSMIDLASGVYLAVAAVGLNFALGLGDVPSLGQGAFVGVGAFTVALLRTRAGWGVEAAMVTAVALAALAGALVGAGAARLRTVYVAVATWIVAWLVTFTLQSFPAISGGAQGIVLDPARLDIGAFGTSVTLTPTMHYEIGLAVLALALAAFVRVARGPTGLALAALREGASTARAAGARATRLRIGVFVTSAALAGLGGAGAVQTLQVADPTAYGPLLSVELFVAVLLGGAGTVLGPVIGVAALGLIGPVARWLGELLSVPSERFEPAISAALLLVALALGRGGIVRVLARLARRTDRRGAPPRDVVHTSGVAPDGVDGLRLEAHGITKVYGGVRALDAVELTVAAGSVHALIGPNGSGKTTLLRILAGAERPEAGEVVVDGTVASSFDVHARLRAGIARTLQRTEVWPDLTVREHVIAGAGITRMFGGPWRNLFATPKARAEAEAVRSWSDEVLEVTGLDGRADEPAARLSSGDQRLLMIALAYASRPRLLLLDEPSAGMSRAHAERLVEVVKRLSVTGMTTVIVEHNLRLVRYLADRVTVLDAGAVIAEGDTADVAGSETVRAAYLGRATL